MAIPPDVNIVFPWIVVDADRAKTLELELLRELSPAHVLKGRRVKALAARDDRDDVLFEVEDNRVVLAVVHLTYQGEANANWPKAILFSCWEDWVRDVSIPAHDEAALGEDLA